MSISSRPAQRLSPDSDERPTLVLLAEGGAICSDVVSGDEEFSPRPSVVQRLRSDVPGQVRQLFRRISARVSRKGGLVLSHEVNMARVEDFAQQLQRAFEESRSSVIALVGSHKIPRYAAAAAMALSPEDLGHNGAVITDEPDSGKRSLILACANNPDDAKNTLSDAMELSGKSEMQGRAGVLFNDKLYALPGLERPSDPTDVLKSRFNPIASKGERKNWYFSKMEQEHVPFGPGSEGFKLNRKVRTFVIDESAADSDEFTDAVWSKSTGGELDGMVIKTSAWSSPLAQSQEEILKTLDRVGVPGITVGCRNGNGKQDVPLDAEDQYNNLLDGGLLFSGEAKLALARWLAEAKEGGIVEIADIVSYVRNCLDRHPFVYK